MTLIVADLGNSSIKAAVAADRPPHLGPVHRWRSPADFDFAVEGAADWAVCSVHRGRRAELEQWLRQNRPHDRIHVLTAEEIPLRIAVERPHRVGIDRLCAAWAAHERTAGKTATITVDLGTAITVDATTAAGEFLGGAILPGLAASLQALPRAADALPPVALPEEFDDPPAIGRSTEQAIVAGVLYAAIGALGELIARQEQELAAAAHVYLTGGDAPRVARRLQRPTTWIPELVLEGTRSAYVRSASTRR